MTSLILFLSSAQAWDYVDDGQAYVYGDDYADDSPYDSGDYYGEAPAGYRTQGVTPEMVYQLLLQRQIENMQSDMVEQRLDNARHQQNLQNIRERGEQWAKSFRNPYMD